MEPTISVEDFAFDIACRAAEKCDPASVIHAFAMAAVKLWAIGSNLAPIEDQDAALEELFNDMRVTMAECQKALSNNGEN